MMSYLIRIYSVISLMLIFSFNSFAQVENKSGQFSFRGNIPQLCGMKILSHNGGVKFDGMETSQVDKGSAKFFNNSIDNTVLLSPTLRTIVLPQSVIRNGYIVFIMNGVENRFSLDGSEVDLNLDNVDKVMFFVDFSEIDTSLIPSGELDMSLDVTVSCR